VNTIGVGLLVDEHRGEIAAGWKDAVAGQEGEPALGFAVAPLLRELALAMSGERAARGPEAWGRIAVLVRSGARPAQLAREVKALQHAVWEAIGASGQPVSAAERRAVDGWLFDALAECLERLERVRQRLDALDRPLEARARPQPPPLPPRPGAARTTH
jgi:hypothetical protein